MLRSIIQNTDNDQQQLFKRLLKHFLAQIDIDKILKYIPPEKIQFFITTYVEELNKVRNKKRAYKNIEPLVFNKKVKNKTLLSLLDNIIMNPIQYLLILSEKYDKERIKNIGTNKHKYLLMKQHPEIDENKLCDCGQFLIKRGFNRPIAVDMDDTVWSIGDPRHMPYECNRIRELNHKFKIVPNWQKERESILISGPSGAGKTYLAQDYLKKYKKLMPQNDIYLFANKDFDNFDLPYTKPNITDEYLKNKQVNDFANSVMVFDDVENITHNPDTQKLLMRLLEEILNVGRSLKITLLIISHILMNYRFTRNMLMECNKIVMFPNSGAKHQYRNFLKQYVGLDKDQIKKLLNTKSRWLMIDKEAPLTALTDNKLKIL